MKYLFALLVLSLVAILAAAGAMWLRFRLHLYRSNKALKNALGEIRPDQESVKQNL
ncbi:MAG TPA: hypothetical protein VKT33_03870 [Candidatus Angelobacter sp.]|nr:hypothetical protein [Candidatus Angelobacter sp.]